MPNKAYILSYSPHFWQWANYILNMPMQRDSLLPICKACTVTDTVWAFAMTKCEQVRQGRWNTENWRTKWTSSQTANFCFHINLSTTDAKVQMWELPHVKYLFWRRHSNSSRTLMMMKRSRLFGIAIATAHDCCSIKIRWLRLMIDTPYID